jgi:predicted transcriptional regulator
MKIYEEVSYSKIIKFLKQCNYGMTTTEVRREFHMRYWKAKRILEKLKEEGRISKTIIGNQILWQVKR